MATRKKQKPPAHEPISPPDHPADPFPKDAQQKFVFFVGPRFPVRLNSKSFKPDSAVLLSQEQYEYKGYRRRIPLSSSMVCKPETLDERQWKVVQDRGLVIAALDATGKLAGISSESAYEAFKEAQNGTDDSPES